MTEHYWVLLDSMVFFSVSRFHPVFNEYHHCVPRFFDRVRATNCDSDPDSLEEADKNESLHLVAVDGIVDGRLQLVAGTVRELLIWHLRPRKKSTCNSSILKKYLRCHVFNQRFTHHFTIQRTIVRKENLFEKIRDNI